MISRGTEDKIPRLQFGGGSKPSPPVKLEGEEEKWEGEMKNEEKGVRLPLSKMLFRRPTGTGPLGQQVTPQGEGHQTSTAEEKKKEE